MGNMRRWRLLKIVAGTALAALAGFMVLRWWKIGHRPLGEAPLVQFPKIQMTQLERVRFLDIDFTIVKNMRALPRPVLRHFTEEGSSRLLMANPGEDFNPSDNILDESIPRKRLIFAGVSAKRCFVFYEQGGIAHMYILAFFEVTSKETAQQLWRGYCEPVANFQGLRDLVRNGQCSDPVPQGMLR